MNLFTSKKIRSKKCDLVLSVGTRNVFIEERKGDYDVRSLNHRLSKIFALIFERPFDSSNRSHIHQA